MKVVLVIVLIIALVIAAWLDIRSNHTSPLDPILATMSESQSLGCRCIFFPVVMCLFVGPLLLFAGRQMNVSEVMNRRDKDYDEDKIGHGGLEAPVPLTLTWTIAVGALLVIVAFGLVWVVIQ